MNDFLQMDIFFFIASVIALVFLFLITIVGVYVFLIINNFKKIMKEMELFIFEATSAGRSSLETITSKINEILNKGGIMERIIATALGTIIAKTFKNRDKIKKDAPKK